MMDLSKARDGANTDLLGDRMREANSPGQIIALIYFMGENTFVCTSYGGKMSDE